MADALRVDDWELRCRYKHAQLFDRWLAGEFVTKLGDVGFASPASEQPPNTLSVPLYYIDRQTQDQVAQVHFFWLKNGRIGASGLHDPKKIEVAGSNYRQRRGPAVKRNPSLIFPEGPIRRGYVFYRKNITCSLFGW
jgi:hypothetical protein